MNNFIAKFGSLLLAIVFFAAGIFAVVVGATKLSRLKSGKFVETQAKITKVESEEEYDADEGMTRTTYKITVEYDVNGTKYVSLLSETPKEFHEGMELAVVYDVDDPNSVSLPGSTGSWIAIILGAIGILVGIVLFIKKLMGR